MTDGYLVHSSTCILHKIKVGLFVHVDAKLAGLSATAYVSYLNERQAHINSVAYGFCGIS